MHNVLKTRGTITAHTLNRTEVDCDVSALNLSAGARVLIEHFDDTATGEIIDARTVLVHCALGRVGQFVRVRRPRMETFATGHVVQA